MDRFGGKWKPRKKRSKTAAYCNEHPISNEARRRPDGYKAEHGIE